MKTAVAGGAVDLEGFGGGPGERFYYTLKNTGAGSQLLSVFSAFANVPLVRLGHCRGRAEEIQLSAPVEVLDCSFYNLDDCEEGSQVQKPYEDCTLTYAGLVKVQVVYPKNFRWKALRSYLLDNMRNSAYWQPDDVTLQWQLNFGSFKSALVHINTRACLQRVIDALPGNPAITKQDKRLLWIEYKEMPDGYYH